jgi:5-methylcytosine-specific restriction endonuclease McrA
MSDNEKTSYQCKVCGNEYESKKAIDSHIGQVHPEEFAWNDEDYIYEEYILKQRTRGEIADELGCSKATITNACERFGFTINREERQASHSKLTDEEWLRDKYENNGAPTIADSLGCSAQAVYCALKRHGIERDDRHLDHPSGEEHPRWKGGHEQNRGYTWPKQRKKALNRDSWECCRCGMSNSEHEVEHSQQIHVHHIIRYGAFENHERANQLENLVTLCRPCHDELEGEPPKVVFEEVKVKGNDPADTAAKLADTLDALAAEGVATTLRETQPEDNDE